MDGVFASRVGLMVTCLSTRLSEVVVVMPTEFRSCGRRDCDGISEKCCSISRNGAGLWRLILSARTHSHSFASAATTLQCLQPSVERTFAVFARCPPPQGRPRSPSRNFIVDVFCVLGGSGCSGCFNVLYCVSVWFRVFQ